jgi:hypothetical protein
MEYYKTMLCNILYELQLINHAVFIKWMQYYLKSFIDLMHGLIKIFKYLIAGIYLSNSTYFTIYLSIYLSNSISIIFINRFTFNFKIINN